MIHVGIYLSKDIEINMDRLLHCLMLITVFIPPAKSQETAVLQGDFHLAGLFQIFSDEHCTQEVDAISVRNFEAVKWTIKTLNKANYIPGLTLGKKLKNPLQSLLAPFTYEFSTGH